MSPDGPREVVAAAGRAARAAHPGLATAGPAAVAAALGGMSRLLAERADPVLSANARDVRAARGRLGDALLDRLRLDEARLSRIAGQIETLAGLADVEALAGSRRLENGLVVEERRRPVGVIGANYEARPNVTVDVASQLVKSRNAGVLRTGAAALGSAAALLDEVIGPALAGAGLDPGAIQLVRTPERDAARALVSLPRLIPLVILRGSGETTAALAAEAAAHGVRTLAHADGGGVLFVDAAADRGRALALVERSLDRLGVCNRLNLLLIAPGRWDELLPGVLERLEALGVRPSLPPHDHPLGHEWALDDGERGHGHHRPRDRRRRCRPDRQRGDLGHRGGHRHGGPGRRRGLPRGLRRHGRLLERHHAPARRLRADGGAGDRDQRGPRPRAARAGDLPRPPPAPVRRHARGVGPARAGRGETGATAAADRCYCRPTRRPGGLLPLAQTSSIIEFRRAQAPCRAHVGGRA